ncbi:MAG: isopentenyl-diphosphate Delta-isomerase [Candidatus Micrarchaeota archaeon]|nr:isopentenyl-diphosphate Delta-isomerase [Candidatus Micrarchaeota archaeon]
MTDIRLVDEQGNDIGMMEKIAAHSNGGTRHRATSIFVFNDKGQTMLQKRARTKYHASGQWTNTADGHPEAHETPIENAHRRLREEMGFDCELQEIFTFKYEAPVGNNLTEKEFDHIIFGKYNGEPKLNPSEAEDWKWISLASLKADIRKHPDNYAAWLRLMVDEVIKHYNTSN